MSEAAVASLYQELRLALVFNGGVSLAVWMGGVAKEIDRFRCAFVRRDADAGRAVYKEILGALRTVVMTDVIAGTSAGGINGALLGYVVANGKSLECADPDAIRGTWQELGSMQKLLYTEGEPRSVLRGDEVLFRGCAEVFAALRDAEPDLDDDASRWVRVAVTATDSFGYTVSAGGVSGRDHRLVMRFRYLERPHGTALRLSSELTGAIAQFVGVQPAGRWPFPAETSPRDLDGPDAAPLLTRAARSTASFPIAFGPSELPLNHTTPPVASSEPSDALTATPPMAEVVDVPTGPAGLDPDIDSPDADASRYAIDGGVWDNSPFSAVLRAIDRTPSGRDVKRVVSYIVGTRAPLSRPAPNAPPGLAAAFFNAVALPADLSFANDLARIREDLQQQTVHRGSVLRLLLEGPPDLFELAAELFPLYRERRDDEERRAHPEAASLPPELPWLPPAQPLPPRDASLGEWWATRADWRWGIQPVRGVIQEGRRLLRAMLRDFASQTDLGPSEQTVRTLVAARELLSQLTWVLDDLAGAVAKSGWTDAARAICGHAMHDFAATASGLHNLVSAHAQEQPEPSDASRAARALTGGGTEVIVKRALTLDITLRSLAADSAGEAVAAAAIADCTAAWSLSLQMLAQSVAGLGSNVGAAGDAYATTDATVMPR